MLLGALAAQLEGLFEWRQPAHPLLCVCRPLVRPFRASTQ